MQDTAACPEGYFRRAVITFKCNATTGVSHVLLAPSSTRDVGHIGAGVKDFVLNATSHMDIDVELVGATKNATATSSQQGADDGDLNGSTIVIEDDGSTLVADNRVKISGIVRSPLILRLRSLESGWGTVTLEYAYAGTVPCPDVPVGCDPFDSVVARESVAAWRERMQSRYSSADEAWLIFASRFAELSTRGIPWFRWQAAWPDTAGAPGQWAESAAMAFHFLDTDRDGLISRAEFIDGYDGTVSWSIPSPVEAATSTPPEIDDVAADEPTTPASGTDPGVSWAPLGVSNVQTQSLDDVGIAVWQTLADSRPRAVVAVIVGAALLVALVVVCLLLPRSPRRQKSGRMRSMDAHDHESEEYLAGSGGAGSGSKVEGMLPASEGACFGGPGLAGIPSPDALRTWASHLQCASWPGLQAPAPFRYTPLPTHDSYPRPPHWSSRSPSGGQLQAPLTARSTASPSPRGAFPSLAVAQVQAPLTARSTAPSSPRGAPLPVERRALAVPVQTATPVPVEAVRRPRLPDHRVVPARERGALGPDHSMPSVLEVQDESGVSLGPHGQPWAALFDPGELPRARRWASTLDPVAEPVAASASTPAVTVMQADREGNAWRLSEGYSH